MKDISLWPRQVINTPARRAYARLLREFARGAVTNREYEDLFDELIGKDTAVFAIHHQLVWFLYCDIFDHRLTGKRALSRQARSEIAKAVLFLHTERPADAWHHANDRLRSLLALGAMIFVIPLWPVIAITSWVAYLICAISGKLRGKSNGKPSPQNIPWPFLSRSDFDAARRSPMFLAGA